MLGIVGRRCALSTSDGAQWLQPLGTHPEVSRASPEATWSGRSSQPVVAAIPGYVTPAVLQLALMDTLQPDPALEAAQAALRGEPGVRLALLFGSFARGQAGMDSDLDIAVDAPSMDLQALAAKLSQATGREVDVIAIRFDSIPQLGQLVRDAQLLHEGQSGAAASWRTRALLTLETDGPWYRRMRDAWLARVAREGLSDG